MRNRQPETSSGLPSARRSRGRRSASCRSATAPADRAVHAPRQKWTRTRTRGASPHPGEGRTGSGRSSAPRLGSRKPAAARPAFRRGRASRRSRCPRRRAARPFPPGKPTLQLRRWRAERGPARPAPRRAVSGRLSKPITVCARRSRNSWTPPAANILTFTSSSLSVSSPADPRRESAAASTESLGSRGVRLYGAVLPLPGSPRRNGWRPRVPLAPPHRRGNWDRRFDPRSQVVARDAFEADHAADDLGRERPEEVLDEVALTGGLEPVEEPFNGSVNDRFRPRGCGARLTGRLHRLPRSPMCFPVHEQEAPGHVRGWVERLGNLGAERLVVLDTLSAASQVAMRQRSFKAGADATGAFSRSQR